MSAADWNDTDFRRINAAILDGRIFNRGNTQINGAQVQAIFKSANGQNLETQTRPVQGLAGGSMTTN